VRILVTGGSGFIGRHLALALRGRHDVLAPTHAELEVSDADAVAAWFARHPVDAVVHTAVRPGHRNAADPSRQLDINLRMYFNLLRCRHSWGRMIYLSSGAVYGVQRDIVRATEDEVGAVVPVDEHGFSRYVMAELVAAAEGVVELRPFGVFGPGEDYAIRFISNAICKTLFDLPVTLRRDRRFSYLYVDDIAPVVERFLARGGGHKAYNVTPDASCRLRELAQLVVRLSGKDLPILVGEEGMGLEYTGDNSRLRAELPGLRFTPLEEAVRRLYGWYADHRDVIDHEALLVDK
jgi:UDP-glucose 4-epimerase